MNTIVSSTGSMLARPIIKQYGKPGVFRDMVKRILTGSADQICPCGVTHGADRTCSAVLEKIATRKPSKFLMALAVQKQRCKDVAAKITADAALMAEYQEEKKKKNAGSSRRRNSSSRKPECAPDCVPECVYIPYLFAAPSNDCGMGCSTLDCDMPSCDTPDCNGCDAPSCDPC